MGIWEMLMESHKCQATGVHPGYQEVELPGGGCGDGVVVVEERPLAPHPSRKRTRQRFLKSEPKETGTRGDNGHLAARPEPWDGNCLAHNGGRCPGGRAGGRGVVGGWGGPAFAHWAGCTVLVTVRMRVA